MERNNSMRKKLSKMSPGESLLFVFPSVDALISAKVQTSQYNRGIGMEKGVFCHIRTLKDSTRKIMITCDKI